jgi:hypothetical protein
MAERSEDVDDTGCSRSKNDWTPIILWRGEQEVSKQKFATPWVKTDIRERGNGKKYKIRHVGEQWRGSLKQAHDSLPITRRSAMSA